MSQPRRRDVSRQDRRDGLGRGRSTADPLHPYTQALLRAATATTVPKAVFEDVSLAGEVPSPINPPSGCRFRTRCPYATQRCADEEPLLREGGDGQRAACHYFEDIARI